ncbi:DUF881 domain-containing protein [Kitasatospora sp. MBT63]|uniref:DUF881 domain-containing protein n=1 Tax=Kitasatospora sp. MBT63 TaxID=1444768 RepID=UPI000AEF7A1F
MDKDDKRGVRPDLPDELPGELPGELPEDGADRDPEHRPDRPEPDRVEAVEAAGSGPGAGTEEVPEAEPSAVSATAEPSDPSEPVVKPVKPVRSEQPVQSVGPEQPEQPEQPGAPEESGADTPGKQDESGGPDVPDAAADGRRRLRSALWPLRISRGQLVVAVLLFSLGLALAIQVRSTNDHDQLRGARQEDLVRILDELDSRQQRLQQEKTQLEQSMAQLENSSNQAKEAQEQTRKKAAELGVLAGTVRATGPGIVLTIDDPQGQVKADMLLDTLQELRAAGAEAIQINDVRVVAGTYFTDASSGGVQIDGKDVSQPFRFTVVGNPQDLTPALNIPGGVVRTLENHQARATITQQQKVVVDALAVPRQLQYGKPAAK